MTRDDDRQQTGSANRQPRVLADRYETIDIVGTGATAITWRGYDRRLDRHVAIKILRQDADRDPAYVQRFEREAQASAAVSSGNVVNVYDVGREGDWLYLVMQLVDGEDLKHRLDREGALDAATARDIARQILTGLAAIHRAGILHRDIKPQNVLIDRDGTVRVTDFGIAQTDVDSGLTTAGIALGTAAYMAPEQAQAARLSPATDIYAVGAVLYEMLTGQVPFERPTAVATMLAHVQDELIPPARRAPYRTIPDDLDAVVMQAMARDPMHRFRSAAAMQTALDRASLQPGGLATTRYTPAVAPQRTNRGQGSSGAAPPPRPRPQPMPEPERGGAGFLTILFVLLLLGMAVVAGWVAWEYLDEQRNDPNTPTDVVETATSEDVPTATTDDEVIVPDETDTPEPTATEEEVLPTATQEQIIEPVDGTPEGG